MTSHIDNEDDSDQIIEEYYRLQAPYNMTDHRRMFHFIFTTRTSKSMCTILEEGAYALQDYFSSIGYQAVMVLHSGSYNDALNYHYHILLNPISTTGYRIQDKYQTYQDIVNYLMNNPVPVSLLSGDRKPQIRFLGNHHSGSGNLYYKSFRM